MDTLQTTLRTYTRLFIDGEWVEPSSDDVIDVISPITEEVVAVAAEAKEADIDRAVSAARKAFDEGPWPRLSPAERGDYLIRLAQEVEKRVPDIAQAFTEEVGAPTSIAVPFVQFGTTALNDAASLHSKVTWEEEREWEGGRGIVLKEPVGVVATIIPWNGPVGTALLKLGPALASGCTVVFKPAPEGVSGIMMLAEAMDAVGFPPGVINVVPAGREVGEYLVSHKDVDKVAFTGSTAAGSRIMSICGERIARVTLELGGKSAAIIADDIPMDEVLPSLAFAGLGHSGQVCAALTRILIPRQRQQELLDALVPLYEGLKVGDPRETDTVLGPLVSDRQRKRVEEYIKLGVEEGARLVTGGGRPAGLERGYYIEPTIFADADSKMRIAQEEIFGPVVVVIPFDSVEEAIQIANDSEYGLSGAVYATDEDYALKIARQIRTGQISINSWAMTVSQPFGGYKKSGLGREGGVEGLEPYVETKLIQKVG